MSNSDDHETVARLEGEDAKAFLEYFNRELTHKEKQRLKDCLEYYKRHRPVT